MPAFKYTHGFLLALLGLFPLANSLAQGCSDAGVCTAGAMHNSPDHDSTGRNVIGASFTIGMGDQHTLIYIPQLEWQHSFKNDFLFEARLPFNISSGDLATISGIGDPVVTISKFWKSASPWRFSASTGFRISLTDATATDDQGRPLPMPYQPGLGTTDFILGIGINYKRWLFLGAGYQQPLIHYNENGYLSNQQPSPGDEYNAFFDSRNLRRSGDFLIRADGSFEIRRWRMMGGPLAIFHLMDDEITDENGQIRTVQGSSGLTLNIAARVMYQSRNSIWEFGGGAPLIVRDARPDGLTREWVLTLRYLRLLH